MRLNGNMANGGDGMLKAADWPQCSSSITLQRLSGRNRLGRTFRSAVRLTAHKDLLIESPAIRVQSINELFVRSRACSGRALLLIHFFLSEFVKFSEIESNCARDNLLNDE